jgi:hypothetical protein
MFVGMEIKSKKEVNEIISDAYTLGYGGIQSYEDIQTWLREVHKIDVTPEFKQMSKFDNELKYEVSVYVFSEDITAEWVLDVGDNCFPYFEALEIGIYEALLLLKLNAVK